MTSMTDDSVRHYLSLPYRIELTRDAGDDDRPWRATVEELPGLEVRGTTPPDAAARVPAAMAEWIANAQAEGREVPEPRDVRAYSGKLLLRMPQSLHAEVALAAERDQVSLNAYINALVAAAVQWRRPAGGLPAGEQPVFAVLDEDLVGESGTSLRTNGLLRFLRLAVAANIAMMALLAVLAILLLVAG
jgi:predicted RNase H-like HicB family nuclease